jgi:hypothetical protein
MQLVDLEIVAGHHTLIGKYFSLTSKYYRLPDTHAWRVKFLMEKMRIQMEFCTVDVLCML